MRGFVCLFGLSRGCNYYSTVVLARSRQGWSKKQFEDRRRLPAAASRPALRSHWKHPRTKRDGCLGWPPRCIPNSFWLDTCLRKPRNMGLPCLSPQHGRRATPNKTGQSINQSTTGHGEKTRLTEVERITGWLLGLLPISSYYRPSLSRPCSPLRRHHLIHSPTPSPVHRKTRRTRRSRIEEEKKRHLAKERDTRSTHLRHLATAAFSENQRPSNKKQQQPPSIKKPPRNNARPLPSLSGARNSARERERKREREIDMQQPRVDRTGRGK